MQSSSSKSAPKLKRALAVLLPPVLVEALTELAQTEDLPVTTLIALLINEGFDHRQRRQS
jgi:hypothetical protein